MLAQVILRIVPLIGCTFLTNMGALVSDVTRAVTVYNTAAVSRSATLRSECNPTQMRYDTTCPSLSARVLRRRR